jgi:hypothetical protein
MSLRYCGIGIAVVVVEAVVVVVGGESVVDFASFVDFSFVFFLGDVLPIDENFYVREREMWCYL